MSGIGKYDSKEPYWFVTNSLGIIAQVGTIASAVPGMGAAMALFVPSIQGARGLSSALYVSNLSDSIENVKKTSNKAKEIRSRFLPEKAPLLENSQATDKENVTKNTLYRFAESALFFLTAEFIALYQHSIGFAKEWATLSKGLEDEGKKQLAISFQLYKATTAKAVSWALLFQSMVAIIASSLFYFLTDGLGNQLIPYVAPLASVGRQAILALGYLSGVIFIFRGAACLYNGYTKRALYQKLRDELFGSSSTSVTSLNTKEQIQKALELFQIDLQSDWKNDAQYKQKVDRAIHDKITAAEIEICIGWALVVGGILSLAATATGQVEISLGISSALLIAEGTFLLYDDTNWFQAYCSDRYKPLTSNVLPAHSSSFWKKLLTLPARLVYDPRAGSRVDFPDFRSST